MEREIKFRGKTINGNEWIYGPTISQGTIKRKANKWFMEVAENKWKGLQPNTLGQYTGLEDKNGKEIYEGDILRVEEFKNESDSIEKSEEFYEVFDLEDMKGEKIREYITPVCWEYGAFAISVSQENDTYLDVLFGDMRRSFPIFIFEIIGNIHDNPELLKDGRD